MKQQYYGFEAARPFAGVVYGAESRLIFKTPLSRGAEARRRGRPRRRHGTVVGGFAPFGLPLPVDPGGAVKLSLPPRDTHGKSGAARKPDVGYNQQINRSARKHQNAEIPN